MYEDNLRHSLFDPFTFTAQPNHPFHMVFAAVATIVIASTLYSWIQSSSEKSPVEDLKLDLTANDPIHSISYFSAIGRRNHQEDRALIRNFGPGKRYFLACCADGHGEDVCSTFLVQHLEALLLYHLMEQQSQPSKTVTTGDCIKAACMDLHSLWSQSQQTRLAPCGSTLTGVFFDRAHPDTLWSLNLGDSKSVLLLDDGQQILETKNHDLSPARVQQVRQQDAAAMIEFDDEKMLRLMGGYAAINMSGSFGNTYDPRLSKSLLREVEIQKWSLKECSNARIVIGSDGIFDDFNAVQVAKILQQYEKATDTKMNAKALVQYVLLNGVKGDNTTAIVLEISS